MTNEINATNARLAQIDQTKAKMSETLEGCDWCCGGGDAQWADLTEEENTLRQRLAALRRSSLVPLSLTPL